MPSHNRVILLAVLGVGGCDTRTLVGREQPTAIGGGSGGASGSGGAPAAGSGGAIAGSGGSGGTVDTDAGHADVALPGFADSPFTLPDAFVGRWTGYFEAFMLMSGSDALVLDLIRQPGQPDRVSVTLGSGTPPDTSGAHPPLPTPTRPEDYRDPAPRYYEGFAYTGHQIKWSGSRLTFAIAPREPFESWCRLRMSYGSVGGPYSCLPGNNAGMTFNDPNAPQCIVDDKPISCELFVSCIAGYCACNAGGCVAALQPTILFDVTFDPPVAGAASTLAPFRLMRAASPPFDAGADGG